MASSSSRGGSPSNGVDMNNDAFAYKYSSMDEILEDLSGRFILNLPEEELLVDRLCIQIEQAHWFYEDFVRASNPQYPSIPVKRFFELMFRSCPVLRMLKADPDRIFQEWIEYKTNIPVYGAIMLNAACDKCVLVKGWKNSAGWGFPRGKVNEGESAEKCAIREVLEETGYDMSHQLVPEHVIVNTLRDQEVTLYIVTGVPEDFPFQTRTRKEISKIEWFRLVDLPTFKRNKIVPGKFYLIPPFIGPLKAFLHERRTRLSGKRGKQPVRDGRGHGHRDRRSQTLVRAEEDTTAAGKSHPHGEYSIQQHDNALDPHMARLLSGLTLSGRTEDTTATRDVGYDSTPSRPVSTDLSSSSLEPSPYLDNLSVTSYDSNLGREAETLDGQRNSVNTPRSTVPPIISTLLPPNSYIPAPLVSSRSGSGGDMSPYSSQGPELPESGKRLKQLALLETVADESARHATISRSGTAMGMAGSPLSYNPPNPASFTPPMNGNHLTNGSPYARPLYGLSAGSNYSQPASATPHISHIPPQSADMYGGVPYIPRRDVRPPSRATAPQNNPSNLLSILQTGPVPNGTHIPANAPYAEHKWHNGPQPSVDPYYMAPLPPTFDRRAASPMLPTNVNRPVTTSNSFRPLPQPHTVSIPSRAPPSSSSTNAANLLSILNAQPGPVSYSRPSPPPSRF